MTELEELRARVDVLTAREEIRDVLYTFTRAMDRGDAEGVKRCYFNDAVDVHWGTFVGNAHEFADYMTGEVRSAQLVTHEVTNPIIDLEGDRAFVESRYASRIRVPFEGANPGQWVEAVADGRYLDVFERRAGVWKIAHRRIVQEAGHLAVVQDQGSYNPDGAPRSWPDDLVYRGAAIRDIEPEHLAGAPGRFDAMRAFGAAWAASSR